MVRMDLALTGEEISFRGKAETVGPFTYYSPVTQTRNFTDPRLFEWFDSNNSTPEYLMELVTDNPMMLGLLLTKASILHGQGLELMRRGTDGTPEVIPREDWPEEIVDFYDFNDLNRITYELLTDVEMVGNAFPRIIFTRGNSNRKRRVAELERISPETVRAYKPENQFGEITTYAVASKWTDLGQMTQIVDFPAFRRRDFYDANRRFRPGVVSNNALILHLKRHLPGFPVYGVPQWYGARYYLELLGQVPKWHIANIINQFGARIHISVRKTYLEEKRQAINPSTGKKYTEREIREGISKTIRDLFTKPENSGRSLLSSYEEDHQGRPIKDFLIESIKPEISDDAYIKSDDSFNNKIISAVGIDATLAGVLTSKGMSSGSEKTQGWNIESAKAKTAQARVLNVLQFIHRFNEWPRDLFWGFPTPSLLTKDLAPTGQQDPPVSVPTQQPDPEANPQPQPE